MWRYAHDDHQLAMDFLERATELDPGFAPAYAYASYVHYQNVIMGWTDDVQRSLAQAYHGLGMALTLAGRLEEAKAALGQSERLSPRDPILWASTVVHALACLLSQDYDEALHWARKTIHNPRSAGYWPQAVLAAALAQLGQMDEARKAVAAALEAKPDLSLAYLATTLPTKEPDGLAPYLEGLRKAGLPD
jgi:adenylate cyclase